jgi:colanic acid biosynthesis glycosyl transferase WcaI
MHTVAAGPRPDILFVVSPPLGLGLSARILSKTWKVPYVFHVADLQPDAAFDLGMLKPGRLTRALYAVERIAYRNAAAVSTLTSAIQEKIIAKGIDRERVLLLPDWAEPSLFQVPVIGGGAAFRRQFGLENKFLVVHAGNMGVKQGLEVVLGAAESSRGSSDIVYVLVGDGATRSALERSAKLRGLRNVRFIPLLSAEMFRELLGAADVSLLTQKKEVGDIVFPSKILTLLAAARPVIASVSPGSEIARVVTACGAGVQVEAESPGALLHAIETLRADPHAREECGRDGRAYAREHWDRTRVLNAFENELKRLSKKESAMAATSSPTEMSVAD